MPATCANVCGGIALAVWLVFFLTFMEHHFVVKPERDWNELEKIFELNTWEAMARDHPEDADKLWQLLHRGDTEFAEQVWQNMVDMVEAARKLAEFDQKHGISNKSPQ